jgi:putative ABC transport system permease protein
MSWLLRCRVRFRTAFKRDALDRDFDRELSAWVDELADRYRAAGVAPGEARRRALADTGGVEQVKELVRETRPGAVVDGCLRDIAYAWRSLLRTPGVFAAIVLTLALGIGANTAIYSVVHTILLQPPPYRAPDRLVMIWANMQAAALPRARLAGPEVVDFQTHARTLGAVAAIQAASAAVTGEGDPEQVLVARVTTNFLDVLGVDVAEGRRFVTDDGPPTPVPPAIVSWPFFERRLGGSLAALGRTIVMDGSEVRIVGVLKPDFRLRFLSAVGFTEEPQILQPFATDLKDGHRLIRLNTVVARLADDATLGSAAGELASISAELARRDPVYREARHSFYLVPLATDSTRDVRGMLLALAGGVLIVLVAACVNVGGLLLARAAGRRREIATLVALGAGRVRLVRQFVAEGLLVAGAGALAGIVTGSLALRAIVALRPPSLSRLERATIDTPVLVAVASVALLWGLIFALAPLTEFGRLAAGANLLGGGRTAGRLKHRTRTTLVVAQIALGTVLVVAASLLVRSTTALYQVDPGFDLEARALTFRLVLPADRYPNRAAANAFSRELEARLKAVPGVLRVGTTTHVPFDSISNLSGKYVTEARNTPAGIASAPFADMRAVSPDLLQTLGFHLVSGRWFTETDDHASAPVSMVDERLASRAWPGQPAVGQRLRLPIEIDRSVAAVWTTVVGVVRHARYQSLDADAPEQAYVPARQTLRVAPTAVVLRTAGDPGLLAARVRPAVAGLDPLLPPYDIKPLATYVARATSGRRFTAALTVSFAGLAMALAAVGLAGLVSYSVASRHREFGVRLALGATPVRVRRGVLSEAALLVGVGLAAGVLTAGAAAQGIRTLLFGVAPTDVASYAGAVVLLSVAGLLASWWPARRASRVNPVDALRSE